jgi:hypothetical protein
MLNLAVPTHPGLSCTPWASKFFHIHYLPLSDSHLSQKM